METEAGRWPLHARAWRRGHRGPQACGPAGPGGAAAGQGYPEAVGRGVGKPKRQAKGLTSDALAAVKATAVSGADSAGSQGQTPAQRERGPAAMRILMDLALLQVMRDGLLGHSGEVT